MDIPVLESAADDHVEFSSRYPGGGAAGDKVCLPPEHLCEGEGISEDGVVQARDAAGDIRQDDTNFVENSGISYHLCLVWRLSAVGLDILIMTSVATG